MNLNKIYSNLKKKDISKWKRGKWDEYNQKLEEELLPFPNDNFLNLKTIKGTMFVSSGKLWMWKQLKYLKKKNSIKFLKFVLEEDKLGNPEILKKFFKTSHNNIQTLYHLVKFKEKTKENHFEKVVEWGGGYGCLAKTIKKIRASNSKNLTYTIIDLPLLSCLQYYYLSEIFGGSEVNIILSKKDKIEEGKINILPVCFLEDFRLDADLFISTWALSESSKYSQKHVMENNYFGAKNILLAYSDGSKEFPRIVEIEKDLLGKGAIREKINYLPRRARGFYLLK